MPPCWEVLLLDHFAIFFADPTLSTALTITASTTMKEVRHLCSNGLLNTGNISVRDSGAAEWKAKRPPFGVTSPVYDQLQAFNVAHWSPNAPHKLANQTTSTESETVKLPCSQSSGLTMPPGSQVCVGFRRRTPLTATKTSHYRFQGRQERCPSMLSWKSTKRSYALHTDKYSARCTPPIRAPATTWMWTYHRTGLSAVR